MNGHSMNGKEVTERMLTEDGYKKYTGENLDIYYKRSVCTHAAYCIRGNAEVFNVYRRPWILPDEGSLDESECIIDRCPSGALKYIEK